MLWSWSLFAKWLLVIHQQNCCFDVWQSLIFVLVLLHSHFFHQIAERCSEGIHWPVPCLCSQCQRYSSLRSISLDIDCHKFGPTSRSGTGAKIKTCCKSKASSYSYNLFLVNCCFNCSTIHLSGLSHRHEYSLCCRISFRCHLNIVLRDDLSQTEK